MGDEEGPLLQKPATSLQHSGKRLGTVFAVAGCLAAVSACIWMSRSRVGPAVPIAAEDVMQKSAAGICDESIAGRGISYKGCQFKTRSGKTCQRWDTKTPHDHRFGDLPENYCRNPDGEPTIWCYTTDPDKTWEFCEPLPITSTLATTVTTTLAATATTKAA